MSVAISIDVKDQVTPVLDRLKGALSSGVVLKRAAASVAVLLKDHLIAKEAQPNKNAWPKTGFYGQAAEHVNVVSGGANEAQVVVSHEGFAQRVLGGTINPVNAKALAIPARAEAYGKLPSDFDGLLDYIPRKGGKLVGMLVGKEGADQGVVFFWLVKNVTQSPDPTVLPTEKQMRDAIDEELNAIAEEVKAGEPK